MASQNQDNNPHFILTSTATSTPFTSRGGGRDTLVIPVRDRVEHAAHLRMQIGALESFSEAIRDQQRAALVEGPKGLQIQFSSSLGELFPTVSLHHDGQGIELLSVVNNGENTIANVYVPDGKLSKFNQYLTDYENIKRRSDGVPLDRRKLIDSIDNINLTEVHNLWTDDPALFPLNSDETFPWEVWLPVRTVKNQEIRYEILRDFTRYATEIGCRVSNDIVHFPERIIVPVLATLSQINECTHILNCIAELRKSKSTAEFFVDLEPHEQVDWTSNLAERVHLPRDNEQTPRICLLDSGVNRAHPLLENLLDVADMHTINPAWGVEDNVNHGTGIAGLSLYGDLTPALEGEQTYSINHRLESVKLVDDNGDNNGESTHHAFIFAEAISRPEISRPNHPRVFNSTITADDSRDSGRPSSWSSMLDSLASDADNNGDTPRLFIQSSGNMLDQNAWFTYPNHLETNIIHDPGQSWNAITVGAFTNKIIIAEDAPGHSPLAGAGGLSPMTTTSNSWHSYWPLKPDVVFEGGNAAKDRYFAVTMSSLSLLTTNNKFTERPLATTNATSAASAQCALMAAQLMVEYPQLRPETIRALIVHSAEWTTEMKRMYLPQNIADTRKNHYVRLVRNCGWGVPNLSTAMWSASNSLTLVIEDNIKPYKKEGNVKSNEMKFHQIPWPIEELESLGNLNVEMTVTLSYFIEPNPSSRGGVSKFYYPSHRLRFDCKRPTETVEEFANRINAYADEEDNSDVNQPYVEHAHPADNEWTLGPQQRFRGSLHQDKWFGTAAELAQRGYIGIFPALGWWRSRPKKLRFDNVCHYSLIVSIRTPPTDIDLYASIQQKIELANQQNIVI